MRTPLTYYGGKQRLAPQIIEHIGEHRAYLEPFAGGAAVLFAKERAQRETLNDLDGTIMRFWRALRERPDELAAAVCQTPYSRVEWRQTHTEGLVDIDDDVEAARRLLVNVDQSFSRGRKSWSAPCINGGEPGKPKPRGRWQPGTWENLPPKLVAAAERLQGVALEHRDALQLIPRWDLYDAVIYCDPPYEGEHRRTPRHGYRVETSDLMMRLVPVLLEIEKASVLLSGYPCDATEVLETAGWAPVALRSRRTVQSREGEKLPMAPEFLWLSPGQQQFTGRLM